ncbi:MAG TPA: class I SAM-dependent methyltransferase [Prolixibacteraceae bacterium]|jgi:trans-aconitate methyltransferase|nr:class I SAM-dependent methyltransferase [Prolixibacteraceae bacterium]
MENFDLSVQRFDEYAAEYAQRYMDLDAYSDSIDAFCNLIPNKKPKILELGCGPGNVTRLLKTQFPEAQITALDLAPRMIAIARKQLPEVDFRVMDVRDILVLKGKFDAVMCSFCLPFLSKADAQKLIADCGEKLNRGGVIYISTMEGNESDAGFEKTSFSKCSEIYFNYHTKEDLQQALIASGFEINRLKLQEYPEPDGRKTIDIIFVGKK